MSVRVKTRHNRFLPQFAIARYSVALLALLGVLVITASALVMLPVKAPAAKKEYGLDRIAINPLSGAAYSKPDSKELSKLGFAGEATRDPHIAVVDHRHPDQLELPEPAHALHSRQVPAPHETCAEHDFSAGLSVFSLRNKNVSTRGPPTLAA